MRDIQRLNEITERYYNYRCIEDGSRALSNNPLNSLITDNSHPNLNDHLCAKIMDANGSIITLGILMEAYQRCIPIDMLIEPDGIWAEVHTYAKIRQLITEQPEFYNSIIRGNITSITRISFMNAFIHPHDNLPMNEILIYNSIYPQRSIRIINLSHE